MDDCCAGFENIQVERADAALPPPLSPPLFLFMAGHSKLGKVNFLDGAKRRKKEKKEESKREREREKTNKQ